MREKLTDKEVAIVMAFADYDMKVNLTAEAVGCHKSTVPRTFNRIYCKTGYNPAEFWDLHAIIKQLEKEENIDRQA